ncbi:unnamed protein product [Ectocarpus fasciculatus]
MAGCSDTFGPEFDSSTGATGFKRPLALLLANRIQRETFCSTHLIMDYLSRKFTHGLPDLGDNNGVLRDGTELDKLGGRGGPGMMSLVIGGGEKEKLDDQRLNQWGVHNPADFRHQVLLGAHGMKASFGSPRALLQGANDRFPSLTFLPGAQFAIAGFLAKPNNYYRIPAVRMVLDVVVYLLVTIALSALVLFRGSGPLAWVEGIAAAAFIAAGALRELRELRVCIKEPGALWTGVGVYFQDPWNAVDVMGLAALSAGLVVRGVDGASSLGQGLYALSAPLFVARILFFAQILPSQGPMIQVLFAMTAELVRFGIVMLVVMVGFATSLHVLLIHDSESFGETFLALFKAMLGDVDYFTAFSGGPHDTVGTILIVTYLVVVTVMLLNLLVAILTVSHSKVQENVQREFKVSKARMIQRYRLIVENDWLPAPFNLAQLLLSGLYALMMFRFRREPYTEAKKLIGQAVSWFVLGLTAFMGGSILWMLSVVYAPVVWYEHYHARLNMRASGRDWLQLNLEARMLRYLLICVWCVLGAPLYLFLLGFKTLLFGQVAGEVHSAEPRTTQTVDDMLTNAHRGVGVEQLRRFLADPMNDRDVREDEKTRMSTVEHLKLLRDRLENRIVGSADFEKREGTVQTTLQAFDRRLQQLESKAEETNDSLREILRLVQNTG